MYKVKLSLFLEEVIRKDFKCMVNRVNWLSSFGIAYGPNGFILDLVNFSWSLMIVFQCSK